MSKMNEVNQTTLQQINMKMPNEPLPFTIVAKATVSYDNDLNLISIKVSGDRFRGGIIVKYNYGTDLYDIEFKKVVKRKERIEVVTHKKLSGIYNDQLAEILWNETFIR